MFSNPLKVNIEREKNQQSFSKVENYKKITIIS